MCISPFPDFFASMTIRFVAHFFTVQVTDLIKSTAELKLSVVAIDAPTSRQVKVRVFAAGVNFYDYLMCRGEYQTKPPLPFTPGTEYSGVVEAVGDKV